MRGRTICSRRLFVGIVLVRVRRGGLCRLLLGLLVFPVVGVVVVVVIGVGMVIESGRCVRGVS